MDVVPNNPVVKKAGAGRAKTIGLYSIVVLLTCLFVALRLTGVIYWPWLLVLSPALICGAVILVGPLLLAIYLRGYGASNFTSWRMK